MTPRRKTARPIRALLLLALLLGAAPAAARVFWQLGGGATAGGLLSSGDPAWSRAYSAPLRINGGRGEIALWGAPQSVAETLAALRQRAADRGGAAWFAAGEELAWGVACYEGRVVRFVITAGPGRYSHLFELAQDFEDYRASRAAPAVASLPDVPEIPGARVAQVLANEATGLTLASARSTLPPAAAAQQVQALLAGAGWQLLLPAGGQAAFYVRGRDLLVAGAVSAGGEGETVITLAHKRRAAEGGP